MLLSFDKSFSLIRGPAKESNNRSYMHALKDLPKITQAKDDGTLRKLPVRSRKRDLI